MMSNRGDFQRRELEWELRHEDAAMGYPNRFNKNSVMLGVYIDGKLWKKMPANQAYKAAQTLRTKGKNAEVL